MGKLITAWWSLTALVLAAGLTPGWAEPRELIAIRSGVAITSLPVRAPLETAEARFTDVALRLVGAPGADSLGISLRATVVPKIALTGKEKPVLYLYATCDDEPPGRSAGVPVATLQLDELPAGRVARTIITTGTVSALVPLSNIACAKLGLVCKECGEAPSPPAAYSIRRLTLALDPAIRDFRLDAPSITVVGDPTSKSFGVAFRGTVVPAVELTGDEKAVIRLYTGCAGEPPPGPEATNVATVELGSLRKGREQQRLATTKDTSAFVPMQDIGCAVIDME
jgi:hypothetical protein